ncbi:PRTRC system protein F [Cupriavidus basilensis]|uniref:PRTRC system protein F n=1 Tax=Cupriavidus basilensis TaxID=68895 RepID=A0ABT6AHZ3_9BURK|nr:PRTRC system protein F [Cupriavidus basilensis]MDF3831431.1 PRTRC system protein F [Cupriavidus basilensis]
MNPAAVTLRVAAPALALPQLSSRVPRTVVPGRLAAANAAVSRFLIEGGAIHECDIPPTCEDSLRACEQALDRWVKRQIGPLHCLRPGFALHVIDEHGHHPALSGGDKAPVYREIDLYWCEIREHEWPVGKGLETLDAALPNLGRTVLQVLREQSPLVYPLFTPDIACDVASYVYWCGEDNEEAALDMQCEEGDEEAREAMREEMVSRAMLDAAYPEWARRWMGRSKGGRRRGCSLRRAVTEAKTAEARRIAADALALSRLHFDDTFRPDIDGEFIGFGAVLSWSEGDVTTRIYDDLLNLAHQAEYCDRIGEIRIPLDDPGAMGAWQRAMRTRFTAIGLIDRLIHQLSV